MKDIHNHILYDIDDGSTSYQKSIEILNNLKQSLIASLIGLVLGIGIVFVMFYFDTTIKSSEEIENKLGLPVIAEIPKAGGKK